MIACGGSAVAGRHALAGPLPEPSTGQALHAADRRLRAALADVLAREPVDLVHLHGLDFPAYLPAPSVPVLATLHLPLDCIRARRWLPRPETWLLASSRSRARCPAIAGIAGADRQRRLESCSACRATAVYLLGLGRICPEKGFHLAIEAAKAAGMDPLSGRSGVRLHGAPRLSPRTRSSRGSTGGEVSWARSASARSARCSRAPPASWYRSLVPETSSLVAMEAIACGTPVVALRTGALAEVVEDGRTGFLVRDASALPDAILRVASLDRERCRRTARERFDATAMTARYLGLFEEVLAARGAATASATPVPAFSS